MEDRVYSVSEFNKIVKNYEELDFENAIKKRDEMLKLKNILLEL